MIAPLHRFGAVHALFASTRASREQLLDFQSRQLRRLVHHAYESVPYYRTLFDRHGLKPLDIRTVSDLPLIAITTRHDLQALPAEQILARHLNPARLITRSTSGSSGRPLTIRRTWLEDRLLEARRLRALYTYGMHPTDKHAFVVLVQPPQGRKRRRLRRLYQATALYRQRRFNCLQPPADIMRQLRSYRPEVITGYPGVLARIANIAGQDETDAPRPRFIVAGAEVLTPPMRQQIAAGFGAPVHEMYMSHEFYLIAWECPETGELHTCDDGVLVEVLKDGRPAAEGERGEVVATNLHAFAMPFIRYRLGDIVTRGGDTCRCGLPFSTIRAVQGRMLDYFPLPDGRLLHPYEINVAQRGKIPWVREFQVTQERLDRVVMRAVPSVTPSPEQMAEFQKATAELLGPAVEFELLLVPEIKLEPTGKFRVYRSLVQSGYDGLDWEQRAAR